MINSRNRRITESFVIGQLVYRLYGLTKEEIRIDEGEISK